MRNKVIPIKNMAIVFVSVFLVSFVWLTFSVGATKGWAAMVHAPLKSAENFDWSAPDEFFTGRESGKIKFMHQSDSFKGVVRLRRFKQAGPYVLTVDTADGATLAGYDCEIWNPWTRLYGETFPGGTNGCWEGSPYADVKLFYLEQYDSNKSGGIDEDDYFGGNISFDVPLINGTYNLKFFIKLDWRQTSADANIMMMNNMNGDRRYGRVIRPRRFNYDEDLIIADGLAAEHLILAESAWCEPSCEPPSSDPGYAGTTGVVFYSTVSDTFKGAVVLSNTVTPPIPQPLQIKLEGMGSLSTDATELWSNEAIGYIGRWWNNTTNSNILDEQYETLKGIDDVLGYVIFDGFDTDFTSKTFALDTSYHVLWTPQPGRPGPGDVIIEGGDYVAYFALTENLSKWRGVFLSENPLEFTIN